MCAGSPPPVKPYRVRHPLSATSVSSASARAVLEIPDRGIERRNGIGTLNVERERAPGGLVAVFHSLVGRPVDPLLQSAAVHSFQTHEGVSAERDPPVDRAPDICAHCIGIHADEGVRFGRDVEASERRPEQGARRHKLARHWGTGCPERIPDQDRGAAAESASQEEVEAHAVGGGNPCYSIATGRHVPVAQFPLEDDLAIAFGQVTSGEPLHGSRRALERSDPRRRAGDDERQRCEGNGAERFSER